MPPSFAAAIPIAHLRGTGRLPRAVHRVRPLPPRPALRQRRHDVACLGRGRRSASRFWLSPTTSCRPPRGCASSRSAFCSCRRSSSCSASPASAQRARVLVYVRSAQAGEGARVLIVGAGSAGSLLLREIKGRPQLGLSAVGFLDDDRAAARAHHRRREGDRARPTSSAAWWSTRRSRRSSWRCRARRRTPCAAS